MNDPVLYGFLADILLVIHFTFVVFVVVGFALILIGLLVRWSWVRNRTFRIVHLGAIGFVVLLTWFGQPCPLTSWENELRSRAGQSPYADSFIEHWLHEILFYRAEPWVFTAVYTCFGALVVLVWFLARTDGTRTIEKRSEGKDELLKNARD